MSNGGESVISWLLLIYSVPSSPTRLRATIWRELKRAGAIYLRDGVAVLPDRDETRMIFRSVGARILEFGGEATLVEDARLEPNRAEAVVAQAQDARSEEFAEIVREAERLLEHVAQERAHRDFPFAEVEELEADLGKLRRWADQVRARDHFGANDPGVVDVLARGEAALASFVEDAYRHAEGADT